jgi:hypothetical protein
MARNGCAEWLLMPRAGFGSSRHSHAGSRSSATWSDKGWKCALGQACLLPHGRSRPILPRPRRPNGKGPGQSTPELIAQPSMHMKPSASSRWRLRSGSAGPAVLFPWRTEGHDCRHVRDSHPVKADRVLVRLSK